MSFRSKVLNALDIKKDHVRIPVYQTFLNPSESSPAVTSTAVDPVVAGYKPYAVSRCINDQIIGPNSRTERLEVLGFVVGDDPGPKTAGEPAHLPDALDRVLPAGGTDYTGIHYLGGLYDSTNRKLMMMRKSAMVPPELDSLYQPGAGESANVAIVNDHTHKDWPNSATEQAILLNDSPAADSLYYHKTQVRFLLTGIDDISTHGLDQASNHRGTVRMLVLRPRVPAVRTRVDGTTGDFKLNYDFLPDWHTELFYDRSKQLGGKLDPDSLPHTVGGSSSHTHHPDGSTGTLTPQHQTPYPNANSLYSSAIVTYGLTKAAKPDAEVELDTNDPHYGHMKVTAGKDHQLTPTDLLMSKVNKQKYAVLHDEVFTLDSLHHGAAAQHIVHVNIPYNKKVKFAGRIPLTLDNVVQEQLSTHTFDTPMNLASRPIVLFLSYNQKISASVEGWTAISEV
jgi:hypothetical protein